MIISFLPLLDIAAQPVAGLAALAVILATLTARWELPGRVPGALAAVVVGCLVYYGMNVLGLGPGLGADGGGPPSGLRMVLPLPTGDWLAWLGSSWREAVDFLPVAIPLALATVVGGIDCTESASAAGDEYPTGQIIAADGLATLAGGLFGGVIQSTPYIGHPAYKAMGARAAYTLATALFVGGAGHLRLLRLDLLPDPQGGRLPDPDLRRPGDHRAVVPRHAPAPLSRRSRWRACRRWPTWPSSR